jgi:AcrR family transcriptional regulator
VKIMTAASTAKPPHRESNSRQRQREQTRQQILVAAAQVFARAGYEAASLADIATRAGVKKALVQYHFPTKEQLWKDAAVFTWTERNDCMAEHLSAQTDHSPMDNMRLGFTALVEFTRENPNWLWFMFHEAAAESERLDWLIEHCMRNDYVLGEEFVRQFQAHGLIRQGPPVHLLHLISGALTYNLLVAPSTYKVTGVDLADENEIAEQVALLSELLRP